VLPLFILGALIWLLPPWPEKEVPLPKAVPTP
jgi:hypothetical protein